MASYLPHYLHLIIHCGYIIDGTKGSKTAVAKLLCCQSACKVVGTKKSRLSVYTQVTY